MLRRWKFTWADGPSIEFDAVARFCDGWHDAPDSAERLAQALAEAAGWVFPSGDR